MAIWPDFCIILVNIVGEHLILMSFKQIVIVRVAIALDEFYSGDWFDCRRTIDRVHNDGKHKLEICGIIPAGRGALIYVSGLWMKISMVASHGAEPCAPGLLLLLFIHTVCYNRMQITSVFFSHPFAIFSTSDDEWVRSIQVLLLRSLLSKRLFFIDYWLKFHVIDFVILYVVMMSQWVVNKNTLEIYGLLATLRSWQTKPAVIRKGRKMFVGTYLFT